jgi:hypothetical protein
VVKVCQKRGIKIVRGRAYHPQSQGSIEIANRIFKRRLRAARANTGIQGFMQLLPLIAWVINTTPSSALPRNTTPYEVWFRRKPPTNLSIYKGELRRRRTRGVEEEECDKNENSDEGSSEGSSEREGNEEEQEDCFIDEDFEQEEAREEIILSELTKRVAEHMKKQQDRIVKKAGAQCLEFEA